MRPIDKRAQPVWIGPAFLVLIAACWIWLSRSSIEWLGHTFRHADFRLNLFLLLAASGLLLVRLLRDRDLSVRIWPSADLLPYVLLCSSAAMGWWIERRIDLSLAMATCFGLGSYALLGLVIDRDRWRRGFVPALLLILCLPFGAQADAYVGFVARWLSAQVAQIVLNSAGVQSVTTETILVLDNGIAHVDVPCSGVRSLWAGAIFFLAATWIERRRLGLAWAVLAGSVGAALVVANILRVSLIVVVAVVLQQPSIAEIIHVPIGVLGFVGVSAGTLFIMRHLPGRSERAPGRTSSAPTLVLLLTLSIIASLALTVERRKPKAPIAAELHVELPEDWNAEPIALADAEQDLFGRFSNARAKKIRFAHHRMSGSVLFVFADSWRSHHPPELCLAGSGYAIGPSRILRDERGLQARSTELDHGRRLAVHWFQSPRRTTDRLLTRIWSDVSGEESRWVLVSVLIDDAIDPQDPRLVDLLDAIRGRVQASFEEIADESLDS